MKTMTKLFPTYEVGSLPKLHARVKALRGREVTLEDMQQVQQVAQKAGVNTLETGVILDLLQRQQREKRKLTSEERAALIDFNCLLNLELQERVGLDIVYDGEGRRKEMYQEVVDQITGFEPLPEMLRSRGPDSWRSAVCVAEPQLKRSRCEVLPIVQEYTFVKNNATHLTKVPLDDPYMITVMSDNRYYTEALKSKYARNPREWNYKAKRALNLALAKNVIRPQVEAVVDAGARWIQLDAPAATLDVEHIPILVEGINAVVAGIDNVKFSLHICYPRRVSLTNKNGYALLFPHFLDLDPKVDHLSLELANADQYKKDLAPFVEYQDQRKFEIGLGVVNITLEQQQNGLIETPERVAKRIREAARILKDPALVYVAPDCGLRQLSLERAIQLYEVMEEGTELARKG